MSSGYDVRTDVVRKFLKDAARKIQFCVFY